MHNNLSNINIFSQNMIFIIYLQPKLFYKLILNTNKGIETFNIETRIKGNWFSSSIQFQIITVKV